MLVDVLGDLRGKDIRGLIIPNDTPLVDGLTIYDQDTRWNVDDSATLSDGIAINFEDRHFGR